MSCGLDLVAAQGLVVVRRLALRAEGAADRLLALALRLLHQAGPLVLVLVVRLALLLATAAALFEGGVVPAVVERGGPQRTVDVDDRADRAGQELAVMGHDDEAGL